MVLPRFPGGWQARQATRAGVTVIRGWDSRQGMVVAAVVSGLLFPLLLAVSGAREALVALLACLVIGLGLGYRLVIAPEGIVYQRTWYGVRWRRQPLPLRTPVVEWSTFEHPEGEGLVLESTHPVTLPAPKGTGEALRQAVQEAIQRAGCEQPGGADSIR